MGISTAISLAVLPADRRIAEMGDADGGAALTPGDGLPCWRTTGIRTHAVALARRPAEARDEDGLSPCDLAEVREAEIEVPAGLADLPAGLADLAVLAAGVIRAHACAAACSAAMPT
jgi:hypothetical protein